MSRFARVERTTKESEVLVELEVDGTGVTEISTGVPFYDHMLAQLGRHGGYPRPGRVDVQPGAVVVRDVRDVGDRGDGPGSGRAH